MQQAFTPYDCNGRGWFRADAGWKASLTAENSVKTNVTFKVAVGNIVTPPGSLVGKLKCQSKSTIWMTIKCLKLNQDCFCFAPCVHHSFCLFVCLFSRRACSQKRNMSVWNKTHECLLVNVIVTQLFYQISPKHTVLIPSWTFSKSCKQFDVRGNVLLYIIVYFNKCTTWQPIFSLHLLDLAIFFIAPFISLCVKATHFSCLLPSACESLSASNACAVWRAADVLHAVATPLSQMYKCLKSRM